MAQVEGALSTTNASVASTSRGVVTGVGTGAAQVVLRHPAAGNTVLGSTNVTVVSERVLPQSLLVYVVKRLVLVEANNVAITSPFVLGNEQRYNITVNTSLTVVDEVAGVVVFASFANQSDPMQISPTHVDLQVDSLSADAIALLGPNATSFDRNSRVIAVSTQQGARVNATWVSCDGTALATGVGTVDVSTAPPIRVDVEITHSELTVNGDPLSLSSIGLPTTTRFDVFLVYAVPSGGEMRKRVTTDPRTTYNMSGAAGRVSMCVVRSDGTCQGGGDGVTSGSTGNDPRIATLANASAGQATITVSFSQTSLVAVLTVRVAITSEVYALLRPYPDYPGSDGVVVGVLSRLSNAFSSVDIYQQARCEMDCMRLKP